MAMIGSKIGTWNIRPRYQMNDETLITTNPPTDHLTN